MNDLKIQVGIMIGGKSVEHDISLISGLQSYFAINKEKYDVIIIYLDKHNHFYTGEKYTDIHTYKENTVDAKDEIYFYKEGEQLYYQYIRKRKKPAPLDVILPVVHGYGVEDGTVAGMLELLEVPYSASRLIPSAVLQDKAVTKAVLKERQYPVLPSKTYYEYETIPYEEMDYPVIVKPAYLGSSIGIQVAKSELELQVAVEEAYHYTDKIIIEPALTNYKEYNCAVIKDHQQCIASVIEEVKHEEDILSFVEKYEKDLSKLESSSNRMIPAFLPETLEQTIKEISISLYQYLDLNGVVRIDYLYDNQTDKLYINEVNNIPGSLSFYLFEPMGISFEKLTQILITNAILTKHSTGQKKTTFDSNVFNKKSLKLGAK